MSSANSSSSDCSSTNAGDCKSRPKGARTLKRPSARRELKRSIEKKFRLRYASLQHAYEQRLEVLATCLQKAVHQVHEDATIHYLKENALTHEYASARLGEVVHECFHGDRERYIKAMSDQIAWQASDLREVQQKLRIVQKRERDAQKQWKLAQRDVQALRQQVNVRVKELQEQKVREEDDTTRCRAVTEERDAARREVDNLKQSVQVMKTLEQENEKLTRELQQEKRDGLAVRRELEQDRKQLQEATNKLELIKQVNDQEKMHLTHLLKLSESKARDVAQALQKLQNEDNPTKLARVESELAHQQQLARLRDKDHEDLKRRYQEFGEQVEQYMKEQTHEKAALVSKGDKQVKDLQTQLDTVKRQAQDAVKTKGNDLTRAMEQLASRQEALDKAKTEIASLKERARVAQAQERELKLQHEMRAGILEKEMKQWRHALEKEQETAASLQKALVETKDKYERKIVSIQDTMTRHNQYEASEKELKARTRWQNEFVAKQDAQIDALKKKYDSALEKQQAELHQARQHALETVNGAAAKWESAKLAQKEEEERERRRQFKDAAREKERKEEQRTLQLAHNRMRQEFDERENRLLERERALLEKEIREERRQIEDAKNVAKPLHMPPAPSVVVLNVSSTDDEGKILRVEKNADPKLDMNLRLRSEKSYLQELEREEHCIGIPLAQHIAELQTKEAQAALRAEERVQKLMQEFQERKESEFRAAMVNVRKGIHKLEVSIEEVKTEKKRVEEQLLSERQAFVSLKIEYEESKDAKRTIVQRLEEANENLGKLRSVVKNLQAQCQSLAEQCQTSNAQKEEAQIAFARAQKENEELRGQLTRLNEAALQLENSLDTSVESSEQSKKGLLDRIVELEQYIAAREEQLETDLATMEEDNTRGLRNVSSQYNTHLRQLQCTIETTQSEHSKLQAKAKEMERSVHELNAAKDSLQTKVETMKAESLKQKKDFADLSRMHKNLTESISSRLELASEALNNEQSQRITTETKALEAEKRVERVLVDRKKCLNALNNRIWQLKTESNEVRKAAASEMNACWVYLQKEIALASVEWKKNTNDLLQAADAVWRRKAKQEKQEWNQCMAEKDKQLDGLLATQRVNDQTKYDQVIDRLAKKSHDLEELERRLMAQVELSSDLQRTVHTLEEEQRLKLMEVTHLQEHLSAAQVAAQQELKEKDQVNGRLNAQRAMCGYYRVFYAALAKQSGMNITGNITNMDCDNEESAWSPQQVSDELTQLSTCLQETQTQAIKMAIAEATVNTTQGVSAPLVTELEAAKKTLEFLWCEALPCGSDSEYDDHLPWYIRAARTVKKERDTNEQMVLALQQDLAANEAGKKELVDRKSKWVEANNLLRFEKDTVLREMELLRQTLEKRKVQELHELQGECDARIEQQKQCHDRVIQKYEQDNETAMNQLRDMLKAERRATCQAKNELIELKMTVERTEEELREAQQKLDKETEELRETASKWKRKAKLAMKNGGTGNLLKAQNLHTSSSSLGTEEDSDASYRMMYPHLRRASNAMADLSSLMEQSLVSIRNEPTVPSTSRRR